MKTLRIYGASDDLIETEGLPGCDEFNVIQDGPHIATLQVYSTGAGCGFSIHAIYDGCWSFAIGQTSEDDEIPDWPVRLSWAGYTQTIEIDCPDDAEMIFDREDDDD